MDVQEEGVKDHPELIVDNVPQCDTDENDAELEMQFDDDDREFLQEGFLENFAVVDACYSDEENESDTSPILEGSQISDSLANQDEDGLEDSPKKSSSETDRDKIGKDKASSRSLRSKESDHLFDKNENVHIRSKASERDSRKRARSKDRSSESVRNRDDVKYRKSSERHRESTSSRRPHYNAERTRSTDDKRKPSSSDHHNSRHPYDRSSDRRYSRREPSNTKDKSESTSKVAKITQEPIPAPIKPVVAIDDLVPPGTEDVQLPQPKTEVKMEEPTVVVGVKVDKSQRTRSQESSEYRKRKRSPELMTRDRVQEDQDRMSRELSMERLRARSREKSRERREKSRERREIVSTSSRIKRELETVRRRNDELQRNRERLLRQKILWEEETLQRNREALAASRRRSISSERFTSRSGRRYSSSRDHSSRHLELSPISGGRMSRHSDEGSFVMSPVSTYEQSRFDHRGGDRRRSFSPISSASSMISMSDEEGKGPRRKRKRSPFWKEMERKLGIKMLSGRAADDDPMQAQRYPFMPVDETAPPPGTYPMSYPPPALVPQYPVPVNYDPGPYFPPVEPMVHPVPPIPVEIRRPNLRVLTNKKKVDFVFKVVPSRQALTCEPPEAPPPPQISSGPDSKMSLSSLLEASLKGSDATKADLVGQTTEEECRAKVPTGIAATVARCDAAISALRVDNVLNVITAGRFTVRPNAPRSGALYTSLKLFNHPAQESMVKLKSPLLRTTLVKLAYTTPPVKKGVAKPKPVPAVTVAPSAQPGNVAAGRPGNIAPTQPGNMNAGRPGNIAATHPGNMNAGRPGNIAATQQANMNAGRPGNVATTQPVNNYAGRPGNIAATQPVGRPGNIAATQPGNMNAGRPGNVAATQRVNNNASRPGNNGPNKPVDAAAPPVGFTAAARKGKKVPVPRAMLTWINPVNIPVVTKPISNQPTRPPVTSNINNDADLSDSDIMFIAEVPKTVNVIATLDLDPIEEVVKSPAKATSDISDISEAELMSDISLSDCETKCASCVARGKVKMVNTSTQYSQNRRSVETQVDLINNQLQGVVQVQTKRARKRRSMNPFYNPVADSVMEDGDDSGESLPPETASRNNQTNPNQSVSKPQSNPVLFQKSSENLNSTNLSFKSFSSNTFVPNSLPDAHQSSAFNLPSSVTLTLNQSTSGGSFFKQSFQSVPDVRQPSIFGGVVPQQTPVTQPSVPTTQKSILKPSLPLQSTNLSLFGGSLLQQPSAVPAPSVISQPEFSKQNFSNPQSSYSTSNYIYPNQQSSAPNVHTNQPYPVAVGVQQQQFQKTNTSFPNNPTVYPGFQQNYPAVGNFLGPGNNANTPVPTMVPPPMNYTQPNVNQSQRPFFNPANQNNPNQSYFPKY